MLILMLVKYGSKNLKVFDSIAKCKLCVLRETRYKVVVGDGSIKSRMMIIGEGPGREEDEQGLPFVGRSGKLLRQLMKRAGLDINTVYITNIVKCRPPENRVPATIEIKSCSVNLKLQLRIIKPDIIVVVGNIALNYFRPKLRIMSVHGQLIPTKIGLVYPIIHPAAALRNPDLVELIFSDLKNLSMLDKPVTVGPRRLE